MVNQNDPRLRGLNGKFSKQDPRLKSAQQRIADVRARQLRKQQIRTEALRLDTEFRGITTGNINEIITAYNNIPDFIKTQMSYNVKELKNTQQNSINSLQDRIKQSRENELRYRKKNDRARIERERARREGYNEGLSKLKEGILIPLNEITSFANRLGSQAYDIQRDRERRREQKKRSAKAILKTGEITSINYEKNFAIVNGKKIHVSSSQIKDLRLSSQLRSDVKQLADKAVKQTLTVSDFEKARSLGISSSDLLKVAGLAAKQITDQRNATNYIASRTINNPPSFRELTRLGVSNAQANQLIKTWNQGTGAEKFKDLNTDKFFQQGLAKGFAVDSTSLIQAYKIGVNQASKQFTDLPQVPFKNNINSFENRAKLINDRIDNFEKIKSELISKENLSTQLKKRLLSTEEKLRTGQSVTPQQKRDYISKIGTENKKLTQAQLESFKNLVKGFKDGISFGLLPVTYGQSLVDRFSKGEPNPLFNDFKNFSKGIGQGLKKIFIDPVISSFNYGQSLVDRAYAERTMAIKILKRDIKKLGKGIKNVSSFAKNHPIETGIIIGVAVGLGMKALKSQYKENPAFFLGEAFAFLFPGTIFKTIAKTSKLISKLSPKFVKNAKGEFILRKEVKEVFKVKGKIKLLKERVQKPSIFRPYSSVADFLKGRKAGQFKKFTKDPGLILKKQTVATGAKSLSQQAQLAGQEITAVNTSASRLTSWLKQKQIIRKPIPGEANFPPTIKQLLSNFDNGIKLTTKQFVLVNRWLKKHVAPNITLLERSLYADPEAGLRISRLGIGKEKTATLRDIITGNFKFTKNKPQVLVFENAKVAKFPKNLKDIEIKLKQGKKLTEKETNRLIIWQVKTGSGKFKPIGSTIYKGGIELEVTLAPGEFIQRIKRIGFTFIEGVKVDFVTAKVWKPETNILKKIKKANEGKLTNKELKDLEKQLSKKLGRTINIETPSSKLRRIKTDVPVLRINGKFIKVLRGSQRTTPRKPTPRKPTPRKPTPRKPTPRKPTPRKPTPRKPTPRKPTPRKPTPRKSTPRKPTPRKPTPGKGQPPFRPKPSLVIDWKTKIRTGQVLVFEGVYRERRNTNQPFNKRSNPIVTKKLRLTTTKNRALKAVAELADRKLIRSIETRIIGKTNKIIKEIKPSPILRKFKAKRSKNSRVLKLVESAKFALDHSTEKREFKSLRRKKGKKRKVKKSKKRKTKKK